MGCLRKHRFFTAQLCLLVVAATLTGCAGFKLRVLTDPPQAEVVLKGYIDKKVDAEYLINSGNREQSISKKIEEIAVEAALEGYQGQKLELTRAQIEALPIVRKHHQIEIQLTKEFNETPQVIIIYDQDSEGFVGRERIVRSFTETRDEAGFVASMVFDGLSQGNGIRGIAISPDGKQLVFAEASPRERQSGAEKPQENHIFDLESCNIKVINLAEGGGRGTAVGHVRKGSHINVDPVFTRDGKHLRFASDMRRNNHADIIQIQADGPGGGNQDVVTDRGRNTLLRPTMGADDTMVYVKYSGSTGSGAEIKPSIWVMGGGYDFETELTEGYQPHVAPDGNKIAFVGIDRNLWVLDPSSGDLTQWTEDAKDILNLYQESLSSRELARFDPDQFWPHSLPSWSPDGDAILYTSFAGNDSTGRPNEDIWMLTLSTGKRTQLTANGSSDMNPVMDPDRKYIYFLSNRGPEARWAIWAVNVSRMFGGS